MYYFSHIFYINCILILYNGQCQGYNYKSYTFTQKVDHFSFSNQDTYEQRYLVNDQFWDTVNETGPIFFYTGNEGDIRLFAENTGFMWEAAQEFKAKVVFAEHRYYGTSLPYGDKSFSSPKYLGYLTSEQALADFIELCQHLQLNNTPKNPVIAFGGSYGGMLAAWIRMKYPHIVQGAIAASAPILQFTGVTPCDKFGQVVTKDFKNEGCVSLIRQSWNSLNSIADTTKGLNWLNTNWKLCKPLKLKSHVSILKDYLTEVWTNLAMIDYPYPANFLAPLPAYPIKQVCQAMLASNSTGSKDEVVLNAVFEGLSIYFNFTGNSKCLDISTSADSRLDDRGWDYQACTEMVMPFCYDGKADMFEPAKWNFTKYTEECFKKWKVNPVAYRVPLYYGAKDISAASNIVFSNGLLDPWSSGGVLKNVSDSVTAIIIPEGAHHLDLRSKDPNDPPSVRFARQFEKNMITKWIHQFYDNKKNK